MSGPIYNAVRHSQGSTGVHQVSPTASNFSGSTLNTLSKSDLRDATRHRRGFAIFTSFMFFVTMVMLILVQIGNLSNMKVIQDLWFFRVDVSKIIPQSAPGGGQGAKSLGLHDFYQVGLWNFCEGYNDRGITACSKPTFFYWFNPVQILLDELLDGATGKLFFHLPSFSPIKTSANAFLSPVQLPSEVDDYLNTIRTASHAMFLGFFCTTFSSLVCVFLCPLSVYSRLSSIPIALFALLSGLCTAIAACISAGIWTIFRNTINQYAGDMDMYPTVGTKMLVLTCIAGGCALLAAFGQLGLMCCGTSRRDIKTGRRVGRRQRTEKVVAVEENPALRRRWWGSVSN
ncbi:MAG: hypothetical protein LQ340_006755 [Diploschistes diacapsis]|nr:MAG: hypothetical protein LQ340_006755 [Diploschistes diacapsis]